MLCRLILAAWLVGVLISPVLAVGPIDGPIRVCPVLEDEASPPADYDRPDCWTSDLYDIDMQDRQLWLRIRLNPLPSASPYTGLLLSMKAASEVFISGHLVGRNGLPGIDSRTELPGRMDAVIPLDRELLLAAGHTVDLKISSHHNWLQLRYPIHGIQLVDYPSQQDRTLRYYLPSLLPMGLFLLAVFYFGSLTVRSEERIVPALLTALAGLGMLQLFFEASRGLFAFSYPVQDLRLIGILICSIGFGLCLAAVLAQRFAPRRIWLTLGIAMIGMMVAVFLPSTWDTRTALVLLAGTAVALGLALIGWRRRVPTARAYAIALALFMLANLVYPDRFIDHGFYLMVAAFLLALMVLQAIAFSRERNGRIEQRLRADQLQRVLDLAESARAPQVLSVSGTGQVQTVQIDQIVRVQGAGDYVELHLSDGSELLHNATLNELDGELPSNFLRVHRSHLVNTHCIERLDRNQSGTGTLHLHNGQTVPVSRRIMPGVRRALR